jgi:hypothetical protein
MIVVVDPWLLLRWSFMLLNMRRRKKSIRNIISPWIYPRKQPDFIFKIESLEEDIFYVIYKTRISKFPLKYESSIKTLRRVHDYYANRC